MLLNDEVKFIKLRLAAFDSLPVSQYFLVVTESPCTFSLQNKRLHGTEFFSEQSVARQVVSTSPFVEKFRLPSGRVVFVRVLADQYSPAAPVDCEAQALWRPSDDPKSKSPWLAESLSRRSFVDTLRVLTPELGLRRHDVAFLGDADEFLSLAFAKHLLAGEEHGFGCAAHLKLTYHQFNTDCLWKRGWNQNFRLMELPLPSPIQFVKHSRYLLGSIDCKRTPAFSFREAALGPIGWHMSYFMDKEQLLNKMKTFSHRADAEILRARKKLESNSAEQYLADVVNNCKDLYLRPAFRQWVRERAPCSQLPRGITFVDPRRTDCDK